MNQAKQRKRGRRLAGTGFSDKAQSPALAQLKVYVIDGLDGFFLEFVINRQIFHIQDSVIVAHGCLVIF